MLIRLLSFEEITQAYPLVEKYLPDRMRNMSSWFQMVHFSVGGNLALVWLSDVVPGFRANIHVVRANKGEVDVLQVVKEIMSLYNLQRLEALIPADNTAALRLAEKAEFVWEGLLRRAEKYDGEFKDMHVYARVKED